MPLPLGEKACRRDFLCPLGNGGHGRPDSLSPLGERAGVRGPRERLVRLFSTLLADTSDGIVASPPDAAVLALDVGTSSCRASLYDTLGRPVAGRA